MPTLRLGVSLRGKECKHFGSARACGVMSARIAARRELAGYGVQALRLGVSLRGTECKHCGSA